MAIQKIADLVGQIDCPNCFSIIQWNNKNDIRVSNGNKYIICPQCGQSIMLKNDEDYWINPNEEEGKSSDTSSDNGVFEIELIPPETGLSDQRLQTLYSQESGTLPCAYSITEIKQMINKGKRVVFSILGWQSNPLYITKDNQNKEYLKAEGLAFYLYIGSIIYIEATLKENNVNNINFYRKLIDISSLYKED